MSSETNSPTAKSTETNLGHFDYICKCTGGYVLGNSTRHFQNTLSIPIPPIPANVVGGDFYKYFFTQNLIRRSFGETCVCKVTSYYLTSDGKTTDDKQN